MMDEGVPVDYAKSEQLFKKIAGTKRGRNLLVQLYFRQKRYREAMDFFRMPSDIDRSLKSFEVSETLIDVGIMYWQGLGAPADLERAMRIFEEAVNYSNSGEPEYFIGRLYQTGKVGGFFTNKKKKALEWLTLSAQKGYADADDAIKCL